jgi:excisionase family DNA binding protein
MTVSRRPQARSKESADGLRLVSLYEAAEYTRTSERTIRRRISDGTLTGYRMGPRLIRVDQHELDATLSPIPAGDVA